MRTDKWLGEPRSFSRWCGDNISREIDLRQGHLARHCDFSEISGLIWDGTARYGASGALSGAERTGKDNTAAIYWAMLKLYAGARPHFTIQYVRHACAHTHTHTYVPPFVRIRLARGADHANVISVIRAPSMALAWATMTINRNEPRRVTSGRRFSEGRGRRSMRYTPSLYTYLIWNSNISTRPGSIAVMV